MRKRELFAAFLAASFGMPRISSAASLADALADVSRAEDQHFTETSTQTAAEFAQELESIYRASIKPLSGGAHANALDDKTLRAVFDGLKSIAFYTESAAVLDDMQALFPEMDRRRLATDDRIKDFNDLCLQMHRRKLCGLAAKSPGPDLPTPLIMKILPGLAGTGRVLDISDDATVMTLRGLPWKSGPRIILLAEPDCNPAKLAIADIEADPALENIFKKHSLLIAPSRSIPAPEEIARWNRRRPDLRMFVAYAMSDWPIFLRSDTPTFLFVKDGEVAYQFGGWSKPDVNKEYRSKLVRGMELIGLMPAPSAATGSALKR